MSPTFSFICSLLCLGQGASTAQGQGQRGHRRSFRGDVGEFFAALIFLQKILFGAIARGVVSLRLSAAQRQAKMSFT